MQLAIFDVDGTLTETSDLDTDCFTHAIEECFALTGIETDWSLYVHPTDAGILEELFQRHFKRSPSAAEIAHVQNSFVGHLQRVLGHNNSTFPSVKGAGHFLTHLCRDTGWACVVATGGWSLSARFKLRASDLVVPCPIISSDDAISRKEILKQAIEASLRFYDVDGFSRIVSVGDSVWDVETAKSLRLPFVGIAQGSRADRLKFLGASHILPDFMNLNEVFKALDDALEPKLEHGVRLQKSSSE